MFIDIIIFKQWVHESRKTVQLFRAALPGSQLSELWPREALRLSPSPSRHRNHSITSRYRQSVSVHVLGVTYCMIVDCIPTLDTCYCLSAAQFRALHLDRIYSKSGQNGQQIGKYMRPFPPAHSSYTCDIRQ